ncbi:MAG: rhomboid family intramembrane serine protease [Bacteroidetes bacterium]|nr:MAG: rhomboid family intramembrane serine protease [Bacteroidota bacterium]
MIPPVIKNLIIINVVVFLLQSFVSFPNFSIENFFALHDINSVFFKPHQLVTYMFLHGSWGHIFFNMFALWMFGSILENYWGGKRFLTFYILCGVGSALLHLVILHYQNSHLIQQFNALDPASRDEVREQVASQINGATLGASGAVFGCLAAFGYLFPNSTLIILPFPFPIKAKWFVLFYAGIELYQGIRNSAGDNVAHWAHLGGAVVGILIVMYWGKHDRRNFY